MSPAATGLVCWTVVGTVVLLLLIQGTPTNALFQTTLDKWATNVVVVRSDGTESAASGGYNAEAAAPLLPLTFQTTIYHVQDTTVTEAIRYYYDYLNQRVAAYGFKSGNSTRSQILLCKSNVIFTFNATWCSRSYIQCSIGRQALPPTARYAASFTLGQAIGGIPVQLWTTRFSSSGLDVLFRPSTNLPVQMIAYSDIVSGVDVEYFADEKLTVDPSAFYAPSQCRSRVGADSDAALRFLDGTATQL